MFSWLRQLFRNDVKGQYAGHSDAVIIACFFNPSNNPYRLLAFQKWYRSIKHLNHRIIECLIGDNAKSQLPKSKYITQINTASLLWHKEALLNRVLFNLPQNYKYVFWLDTDVLFTNKNWLVEGVKQLQSHNIIQPFEYCVHLQQNQLTPDFDLKLHRETVSDPKKRHPQVWRSFAANHATTTFSRDTDYDRHGHVGFAWGARRELLDQVPLYDKALIGGADHIMAHAAAGHIPHQCITKSFTDNISEVERWSKNFHYVMCGKISYVSGDLYHIWHGAIENRQYLKRIKDFTPETTKIQTRDDNGLYVKVGNNKYMEEYYRQREVVAVTNFNGLDDGFTSDMGYSIWDYMAMVSVINSNSPSPSSALETNLNLGISPEIPAEAPTRNEDLNSIFDRPAERSTNPELSELFTQPAVLKSDLNEIFTQPTVSPSNDVHNLFDTTPPASSSSEPGLSELFVTTQDSHSDAGHSHSDNFS